MKKKAGAKKNEFLIGIAVIVLTMLYLLITGAIAQDAKKTSTIGQVSYKKAYLSWGDVWEFDGEAYSQSNYSLKNAAKSVNIYTSKTAKDNANTNITVYDYYGQVTTGDHSGVKNAKKMEEHLETHFRQNVTQGEQSAPIDGVNIPVMSTDSTGTYSIVPNALGTYRIYAYSKDGTPNGVKYALINDYTSANAYQGTAGQTLSFNPVGDNWYYAEVDISNIAWSAWELDVTKKSGSSMGAIADTNGGETYTGKIEGNAAGTLLNSQTYYYNIWTASEIHYDTVLVLQFPAAVSLGPITKADGTFSISNDDTKGTIAVRDIFGQNVGTSYSGVHIPLFISATSLSEEYSFTGITANAGENSTITAVADGLYRYDFESTANLTTKWEKKVDLPRVTVNGSTILDAYFNPIDSVRYPNGTDTPFTFTADFSEAVAGAALIYTVNNNGTTTSGTLTAANNTLELVASFDTVTVTFTATGDGVSKTMTYTITGSDAGKPSVAKIGDAEYCRLEDAFVAANNNTGSDTIIFVATEYTMYSGKYPRSTWVSGNKGYTLPGNDTFVVPYSEANGSHTTTPAFGYTEHVIPEPFRTLIVPDGISLTIYGSVNVDSYVCAYGTGINSWNGTPSGPYGCIKMQLGSKMQFKSGSNLYCYGYVSGDGELTADDGAKIYELFQLRCYRGGSITNSMTGNSQHVFPMNQYYVQNVEAPITFYSGATEYVWTAVNVATIKKAYGSNQVEFIGENGMFKLSEAATLTKRYLATTDHLLIEVDGDMSINALNIAITGLPPIFISGGKIDIESSEYVLPITNNLDITIHSGTTSVTSGQDLCFLPGAVLTIDEGAAFNISTKVYVYDLSQWGNYGAAGSKISVVGYSTANGTKTIRTADENPVTGIGDAKFVVNGTLRVTESGHLYTTKSSSNLDSESGANITSTGENGNVIFNNSSVVNTTTTYQYDQSAEKYPSIDCDTARLRNGDGSCSYTTDACGGWTYYYDLADHHWYRYRVEFQKDGSTIGYGYYCTTNDKVEFDASFMKTLSADVTSGTANVSVDPDTRIVTVTNVVSDCVVTLTGTANKYRPTFVLSESQYKAYEIYTGNTITQTITIDGAQYYVVDQAQTIQEVGTEYAAPTDEAMGIAAKFSNGIIWNLSGTRDGGDPYLGVVPAGDADGDPIYIYGFYTGYVAYNSFTDKYYETLADAMKWVPQSGEGYVRLLANCGTFTEENGTTPYSIYPAATVTLDLNGFSAVGRIINQGSFTLETNGGTFTYKTGLTAASNGQRALSAVLNSGTMTIHDSSGRSGHIISDAIEDNTTLTNYTSVVRNESGGVLTISDVTLESTQNVNNNIAILFNYNNGRVQSLENVAMKSLRGYAVMNYGGRIENVNNCTVETCFGIENRNIRGNAPTAQSGATISAYATIDSIKNSTFTVGQYAICNRGVITELNHSTFTAHPDSAQVNTIGPATAHANGNVECFTVYNDNTWWETNNVWKQTDNGLVRTLEYKEEEAYRPTIHKILNCTITAENTSTSGDHGYALYNYGGVIGEIVDSTIQTYKHPNNSQNISSNYALRNMHGGIIKSISGTAQITATGSYAIYNGRQFTLKAVYTYPNVLGTNSVQEVYSYGEPSQIAEIDAKGTISAANQYAVCNSGYIGKITGGATYKANYHVIRNVGGGTWVGDGAYLSREYTRVYADTTDKSTEYERKDYYVCNLDKGGLIEEISDITITGSGINNYYLLRNQGNIKSLTNCEITTSNARASYPLVINDTERQKTVTQNITTGLTNETDSHLTVKAGVATKYERDYTYDVATIDSMQSVVVSSNSSYAARNCGKIVLMTDCTITGSQYSLSNEGSGSYTERHTLQYYSGAAAFTTNKALSELEKSYKKAPAEIGTIDQCTITTPSANIALQNGGHIGTIQNSTITAGTTTAKNNAISNTGNCVKEYTDNIEEVLYVTANSTTACTAEYGKGDETRKQVYEYEAPVIDLIGENNTISGGSTVIANKGIITQINGGESRGRIVATTQKGNAVYNYEGTLQQSIKETPYTAGTAGTAVNTNTYSSAAAHIGIIKNYSIITNGIGICNGNSNAAYLVTIDELGAGLEIHANCTTAGYEPIRNTTYAKIGSITGGIYAAAKAGTRAYNNANTNAEHATVISNGDFKGGTMGRENAINNPNDTTRQTYTEGYTLSYDTHSVTLSNGSKVDGYYYLVLDQITIKFDGNGGAGSMEPLIVSTTTSPVTTRLPDNQFTRDETWEFIGWATDKNTAADSVNPGLMANQPVDLSLLGEDIHAGSEVTLYAIWKPNKSHSVTVSWNSDKLLYNYQPNVYEWDATNLCYVLKTPAYWKGDHIVTITNTGEVNNTKYGKVNVGISYTNTNTSYSGFSMKYYNPDTQVEFTGTDSSNNLAKALDPGGIVKAQMKLIGDLPTDMASGTNIKIGRVALTLTTAD